MMNSKGETIVETLVAVLVTAVCFLMLQTSVVTAARINNTSKNQNEPFNNQNSTQISGTGCSVKVSYGTNTKYANNVKCYQSGEYYYYE